MRVPLVGRLAGSLLVFVGLGSACGGKSDRFEGDGSAGESEGGTGGSGGSAGSIAVGGAISTTGGVGAVSGTAGTGGSSTAVCSECPPAKYGVLVQGDGDPFNLSYNGSIPVPQPTPGIPVPACPEEPVRGGVAGCGGGLWFSVCEGPASGPACLEIYGNQARYLERSGMLWSGIVRSKTPDPSSPGIASGKLTLELSAEGNGILVLDVSYVVCAPLGVLLIPC